MESTTSDGDVAKFIYKYGEGVFLISFKVDKTKEARTELTKKGYQFIGDTRTFRNCEYTFLHPKKMSNVLVELIDES